MSFRDIGAVIKKDGERRSLEEEEDDDIKFNRRPPRP